eukprot:s2505_g6.t1
MTGLAMPKAVITSLLNGGAEPGQHVGILNLSPYDGCLEKVALSWHLEHPDRHLSSLSLSTDMDLVAYNEKVVALYLVEVFCGGTPICEAIVPAEDEEEEVPRSTTFAEGLEPDLMSDLLDKYIVECRFAGRTPGTSLYLAHAVQRDGTRVEMVPNRSPSFGDGPASAPKEPARGVKLDETKLPMVSHTADRKKLDKALSKEQYDDAKQNVDSALKEVTAGRKGALKKQRVGKNANGESDVTGPSRGSKGETPKETLDALSTPKMNPGKEAGRVACKRLLDSLVRPAKAPEEKKPRAASAPTDNEDQEDQDNEDSEETLELPGKGDSNDEGPGNDAGDGSDVESVAASKGDDSTKGKDEDQSASLRTLYWSAVHEAQKRIKREFPDLPAREVLKRARAECLGCI